MFSKLYRSLKTIIFHEFAKVAIDLNSLGKSYYAKWQLLLDFSHSNFICLSKLSMILARFKKTLLHWKIKSWKKLAKAFSWQGVFKRFLNQRSYFYMVHLKWYSPGKFASKNTEIYEGVEHMPFRLVFDCIVYIRYRSLSVRVFFGANSYIISF